MPRHGRPALSLIATHPELSARRSEVDADGIARVSGHGLALDRPPRLALRHPGVLPLPGLAAVACDVRRSLAARARARPDVGAVHGEGPDDVIVAGVNDHGEANVPDARRHIPADAHPLV